MGTGGDLRADLAEVFILKDFRARRARDGVYTVVAGSSSNEPISNDQISNGGPPGDRTRDTLIKSQVLYH